MKKILNIIGLIVASSMITSAASDENSKTNGVPPPKLNINQVFEKFDTNTDGKISKDESHGRINENFDKIDTNKDGFVTKEEVKAFRLSHENNSSKGDKGGKGHNPPPQD